MYNTNTTNTVSAQANSSVQYNAKTSNTAKQYKTPNPVDYKQPKISQPKQDTYAKTSANINVGVNVNMYASLKSSTACPPPKYNNAPQKEYTPSKPPAYTPQSQQYSQPVSHFRNSNQINSFISGLNQQHQSYQAPVQHNDCPPNYSQPPVMVCPEPGHPRPVEPNGPNNPGGGPVNPNPGPVNPDPVDPNPPVITPNGQPIQGVSNNNVVQGDLGANAEFGIHADSASILNNKNGSVDLNIAGQSTINANGVGNVTANGIDGAEANSSVTGIFHAHSSQSPSVNLDFSSMPGGNHKAIAIGGSGTFSNVDNLIIAPTRGGQEFRINGSQAVEVVTAQFNVNGNQVDNTGITRQAPNMWVDGSGNRYIVEDPNVNMLPDNFVTERNQGNTSPANIDFDTRDFLPRSEDNNNWMVQTGRPDHATTATVNGQSIFANEVSPN